MNDLSTEEVAAVFLEAKKAEKEATEKAKLYQAELDRRLSDGDELTLTGLRYRWSVSVGKSVPYKKVLDWLFPQLGADLQVMVEEQQVNLSSDRTTKTLRPIKG